MVRDTNNGTDLLRGPRAEELSAFVGLLVRWTGASSCEHIRLNLKKFRCSLSKAFLPEARARASNRCRAWGPCANRDARRIPNRRKFGFVCIQEDTRNKDTKGHRVYTL